jgi:hypothetical protein
LSVVIGAALLFNFSDDPETVELQNYTQENGIEKSRTVSSIKALNSFKIAWKIFIKRLPSLFLCEDFSFCFQNQ